MDFYCTKEEAAQHVARAVITNPKYKWFRQTHFTAGNKKQFFARINCRPLKYSPQKELHPYWTKFSHPAADRKLVHNTFLYMFEKFKKGIYVCIRGGQLDVFLPFSKVNYFNEWGNLVDIPPEMRKYCQRNTYKWIANNGLIRYERRFKEFDSGICMIKDMFNTLCQERDINDIEFFINKRDYPMIKRDSTEPYGEIYGDNYPLKSHQYEHYAPILSQVTTQMHADIPIPTFDDWSRVNLPEKYFPHCTYDNIISSVVSPAFEDKIPTAVFRGTSTGGGVTPKTNMRIKLAIMSKLGISDDDGIPLIDAGITKFNLRYRKVAGKRMLQTITVDNSLLKPCIPYKKQVKYKYIIVVDGHSAPFRLMDLFALESVLLIVESKYNLWISQFIKPYVHYVPVRADLEDLFDVVRWCKTNEIECRNIVQNARRFFDDSCGKDSILDYLAEIINSF